MAGHLFAKAGLHFAKGDIPWAAATENMMMALFVTPPTQATAEVYSTTGEVTTANGYTRGGIAMVLDDPVVVPLDGDTPAYAKLAGSDVIYDGPFTATADYAVVYLDATTKYLVGYLDLGGAKTGIGGEYIVECPATGWFNLQTP